MSRSRESFLTEIHGLDVCTRPLYHAWTALTEVETLRTILEAVEPTDGSNLSKILTTFRDLPIEIQRLILEFLAPFPEVIALSQTPKLLSEMRKRRVPCKELMSVRLNKGVCVSKVMIAGNHYMSRITNCSRSKAEQWQKFDLNHGRLLITRDNIGVRNICRYENDSHPESDQGLYYSCLDLTPDLRGEPLLTGETDVRSNLSL